MSSSSEADAVANLDPRRPTAHLTIEEVGRLAGVSRNTVSLALANSPRVRPETRQRVLEVVRATGYQRNSAAAALAGGSTRTLGVVEFGPPAYLSDRVYLGYLAGIEEATSASGYDLLLLSARRPADPRGLLTLARARRFDGLVLLGQETDRQVVAELLAENVTVVHIGRRVIAGHDLPFVTPDYHLAGRLAVERLIQRGARHIVYITAVNQPESRADVWEGIERAVCRQRQRGASLTTAAIDLEGQAYEPESPEGQPPVGLIAHGSRTSMTIWRAHELSHVTPQLVAYDDEGWLADALPKLDLLWPSKRLIGHRAALLALDLIAGRQPVHRHLAVPPEASWLGAAAGEAVG